MFQELIIFILVISSGCSRFSKAETLESHSFEPPFTEVDSSGDLMVNKHWRDSGHALVSKNFVRLTPDRQSKKGALWSRRNLGVDSFTSTLKFRISGQGRSFFGDGIGLWVTNSAYYTEGDLHGTQEHFYGVGVIFDTFKNTENLAQHRDVTILVNDGSKTVEHMVEDVKGCTANVRYHNERADFSAKDASRAQVTITDTHLKVMVDERNTGDWIDCVDMPLEGLDQGWLKDAYLGITASTGQLADNHDVISMTTDSDPHKEHEIRESEADKKKYYNAPDAGAGIEGRLAALEKTMNTLMSSLEHLELHTEMEMTSIDDKIGNILGKLAAREDRSESRLEDIEAVIADKLDTVVGKRLSDHEARQDQRIIKTIGSLQDKVESKLNNNIGDVKELIEGLPSGSGDGGGSDGSWKLPFLFLCLVVFVACVGAYRFYHNLQKKHFL